MRLNYHPDAETELIESAQYYERQLPTLGAQFLDSIERAIEVIEDAPQRWRIITQDVRKYLLPRFPFSIYYRVLPEEIRVLAVKHHSRRPEYWHYRFETS